MLTRRHSQRSRGRCSNLPWKRQRAAAPERAAPQRPAPQRAAPTQTTNWSGGQVGGSNGVSSVNNNFVEPGAYICPPGSSFGSNCFETPFSFSGHPVSYTIGPFLGYRLQFGNIVVGIEGDASYKKGESSLFQSSSTSLFPAAAVRAPSAAASCAPTSSPAPSSRAGIMTARTDSSHERLSPRHRRHCVSLTSSHVFWPSLQGAHLPKVADVWRSCCPIRRHHLVYGQYVPERFLYVDSHLSSARA
jgi:hypothetical protein